MNSYTTNVMLRWLTTRWHKHHKRDVEMTDNAVAQTSCRSAYSVTDVPSQPSWVTRNEPGLPRKKQKGGKERKNRKRKHTRTSRLNLAH
jgi:hypothetical protein